MANTFYSAIFNHMETLTHADTFVYFAIGELGNDALQSEIAELTGLSDRQVRRSIARLKAKNLITVTTAGRRNIYVYVGQEIQDSPVSTEANYTNEQNRTPHVSKDILTDNIKNKEIDYEKQMALVEDTNFQNLGSLDITPHNLADLETLEINPTITQPFPTAPDIIKLYTPAQILIAHDPGGEIAANLAHWREAHDAGEADLSRLKPALIWCKIVEGQDPPPLAAPSGVAVAATDPSPVALDAPPIPTPPATESNPILAEIGIDSKTAAVPDPSPPVAPPPDDDPAAVLWSVTLASLAGSVTRGTFNAHLAPTTLTITEAGYIIHTPNPLSRAWLHHRLKPTIARALAGQLGQPVDVEIEGF